MEATRANAHRLFLGCRHKLSFNDAIAVRGVDKAALNAARTDIRAHLRKELQRAEKLLPVESFFESTDDSQVAKAIARSQGRSVPELSVKFLTQGSMAYETAVAPCHENKQQLDLDDGIYVPMRFIDDNRPLFAARALFQVVENALGSLCRARGWQLIGSDHPQVKNTCVRVELNTRMHIDLPLYAIPDKDYDNLKKALEFAEAREGPIALSSALAQDMPSVTIDPTKVQLAHRVKGWEASDPRRMQEWFDNNIKRYGMPLRRACCYIKAWRDFCWVEGGPSSIILMTCVVTAFKELKDRPADERDDLLALRIAQQLPEYFARPIANPALPRDEEVIMNSDWTSEMRAQYRQKAMELETALATALNDAQSGVSVVRHLQGGYGSRVPNAPEVVSFTESEQYAEVISHKPAVVAAPLVKPSVSA